MRAVSVENKTSRRQCGRSYSTRRYARKWWQWSGSYSSNWTVNRTNLSHSLTHLVLFIVEPTNGTWLNHLYFDHFHRHSPHFSFHVMWHQVSVINQEHWSTSKTNMISQTRWMILIDDLVWPIRSSFTFIVQSFNLKWLLFRTMVEQWLISGLHPLDKNWHGQFWCKIFRRNQFRCVEKTRVERERKKDLLFHQLHSSLLNVNGPFRLVNALRRVEPGETTPIKLAFRPNEIIEVRVLISLQTIIVIDIFQSLETLELGSESSKLTLCLRGKGNTRNEEEKDSSKTFYRIHR